MYTAKVLSDSVANGTRLTTLEVTMPRIILAEFNTHRVFSRNSASSRAIPVERRITQIRENPFVPSAFTKNQRGMQAEENVGLDEQRWAAWEWAQACDVALHHAERLAKLGVHKQHANRLLEPFSWTTVICSSTEWDNYWALRISEHAQPEIRVVSENMKAAMDLSVPQELVAGEWHLPLVQDDEKFGLPIDKLIKLSVARCARVSYLTHDGVRDWDADLALYDRLVSAGHMSPLEHAAVVGEKTINGWGYSLLQYEGPFIGNYKAPWIQHRKMVPNEEVFRGTNV